jgi:hypothetical protein
MPVPSDPFNFVNGATADADQVDARFLELYKALNPAIVGLDSANVQDGGLLPTDLEASAANWARTVHQVSSYVLAGQTAVSSPFVLIPGSNGVNPTNDVKIAPLWVPDSASVAMTGKVPQVRVVADYAVNSAAPVSTITVDLRPTSSAFGGAAVLSYALGAAVVGPATITTPAALARGRAASAWVNLSVLTAVPHLLCYSISANIAASSVVGLTSRVELKYV